MPYLSVNIYWKFYFIKLFLHNFFIFYAKITFLDDSFLSLLAYFYLI